LRNLPHIIRTLLLLIVLETQMGPQLFLQQASAGPIVQSRIVYYSGFIALLITLVISAVYIRQIAKRVILRPEIAILALSSVITGLVLDESNLSIIYHAMQFYATFLILVLVYEVDGEELLRKRLTQFFIFTVIAHAMSYFIPSMSIAQGGELAGTYRGLSIHRGDLSFVLIVATAIIISSSIKPVFKTALVLVSCFMILMSGSAQGVILLIVAVAVMAVLKMPHSIGRFRGFLIGAFVFLICSIFILYPDAIDQLFGVFSRDRSFTGRDRIWSLAFYLLKDLPLFGFGLGSFQSALIPDDVLRQYGISGIVFGSTHSAYIEVLYCFGWLGAISFYALAARQAINAFIVVFGIRRVRNTSAIALTFFCVVGGITAAEKIFLPGAGWMTFMISIILLDGERNKRNLARISS